MSLSQFFHMGGYAAFVWPSYVLAALVIQINVIAARRSLRAAQSAARRRFEMSQASGVP